MTDHSAVDVSVGQVAARTQVGRAPSSRPLHARPRRSWPTPRSVRALARGRARTRPRR